MSAPTADNAGAAQEQQPVYLGSCHCGFISYSVRLNLTTPNPQTGAVITKCNCTMCVKGAASLVVPEEGSFKLLTPAGGIDALPDYTFNKHSIHYHFCPKCGIRCFLNGTYEMNGQKVPISRIYVSTLDKREDGNPMPELKDIKTKYFANRDTPSRALSDEPNPGGMW